MEKGWAPTVGWSELRCYPVPASLGALIVHRYQQPVSVTFKIGLEKRPRV